MIEAYKVGMSLVMTSDALLMVEKLAGAFQTLDKIVQATSTRIEAMAKAIRELNAASRNMGAGGGGGGGGVGGGGGGGKKPGGGPLNPIYGTSEERSQANYQNRDRDLAANAARIEANDANDRADATRKRFGRIPTSRYQSA